MYFKRILDINREKHTMNLQHNINKFKSAMKINKLSEDSDLSVSNDHLSSCLNDIADNQNKDAFKTVFKHFAPRLKSYLIKLGAVDNQAEEVIQEVMIAVWTKSASYDKTKSSVGTWIYTIARNKRIDKIRKEKRHYLSESDEGLEIPVESTQENEIFSNEISFKLKKYINNLPKEQGKLLKLSYFYDKTHADISEELNIPLGTVKSRIRLALTKMRHLVEIN
jgi:RNA polymerase sigma-70 factor (ECF subfamily)